MNASVFRNTKFEFVSFQQGPNSFLVRVLPRAGGAAIDLEVPESLFTDAVMQRVQDGLEALEKAAEVVYKQLAAKPEDLHETIGAALQAKKDLEATQAAIATAQQAADLAAIAAKADLDTELEAKRKEAEQLAADIATMRAAVEQAGAAQPAPETTTEETTKTE